MTSGEFGASLAGEVNALVRRQSEAVEARLRDYLAACGVDPDDRTDGWEDRARAVLGDLELHDSLVWEDDYRVRMETTIRRRPTASA